MAAVWTDGFLIAEAFGWNRFLSGSQQKTEIFCLFSSTNVYIFLKQDTKNLFYFILLYFIILFYDPYRTVHKLCTQAHDLTSNLCFMPLMLL